MLRLGRNRRAISSIEAYACNCSVECVAERCRCGCYIAINNANDVTHAVADPVAEDRDSKANTQGNYRK